MYRLQQNIILDPDDCSVIIDSLSNKYYELNEVSQLIVIGIMKGMDLEAIVNDICSKFEIGRDRCFADCEEFVQILVENHIVIKK